MALDVRRCRECGVEKPVEAFRLQDNGRRPRNTCRDCESEQRRRRRESDYEALKPEDFEVSVGNDGRQDPGATQEKRQEYSRSMGEYAQALHGLVAGDDLPVDGRLGDYVARLAEQERRFGNRRLARSVSLAGAQEALHLRLFKEAAEQYLSGKVVASGFAKALRPPRPSKRSVVLLLSDLHIGAELDARGNPAPFGAVEEARRLEFLLRETVDYKPRYRADSELVLLLNGDLVEGMLQHDLRDGAPLVEQKCAFWSYFATILAEFAAAFPRVRVFCQPGNHGRDKLRHPGRASSSKWDGHEWEMYWALSRMCSGLKNVSWDIPFRAVSVVDLHGAKLLLTHGDTEVPVKAPTTGHEANLAAMERINASRVYGVEFQAAAFGHWHDPLYRPGKVDVLYNGALVPPNGHARGMGAVRDNCGQWLFESVEGHVVGDLRFLEVGPAQDRDERLGTIVKPFRFPA